MLNRLPSIRLDGRPEGLKFKAPQSALDRFNPTLRANKDAPGEIEIFGTIGDIGYSDFVTAKGIKEQLKAMGKSPVMVTINSPGGDAFEGITIYNMLVEHPGKVSVTVLGEAASAASMIAMAGDSVRMAEGALMMIHSASGLAIGNEADLREFAEILSVIDNSAAEIYGARTGIEREELLAMMRKETWMGGADAVSMKFADAFGKKKEGARQSSDFQAMTAAAASGKARPVVFLSTNAPGASGRKANIPKGRDMKTITEQIAAFEAKRQASAARREEIQAKAIEENRAKDESEKEEFDTLSDEIRAIDDELVDLKLMEAQKVAAATPIKGKVAIGEDEGKGRGGNIISVRPNVEKGIGFTRYVKALAMARGNVMHAAQIAKSNKSWMDTTPEVSQVLMAAVDAGDTTTSGWASELVYNQNLAAEFIELLRPQTIIGKLMGLTRVPFNVRMSGQDSGSSAYWVGQGKPVPVSKLNTLEVTLGIAKAAGLVVLTDELVRSSSPSAEMLVRNDLMGSISEFLDKQFVDPDFAAVANVSPASITNGLTPVTPSGTNAAALRTDVQTLFDDWIQGNLDPTSGVWIMSPTKALAISLMRTSLDTPEFPGITMNGGTFFGLPVVVSNSANQAGSPASGDMIILVNQKEVLLADDGQITIDASREASLEMLDNPTNQSGATATATSMVSMFQTNSVAIKAVRYINWKKRRSIAVSFIQHAAYVA